MPRSVVMLRSKCRRHDGYRKHPLLFTIVLTMIVKVSLGEKMILSHDVDYAQEVDPIWLAIRFRRQHNHMYPHCYEILWHLGKPTRGRASVLFSGRFPTTSIQTHRPSAATRGGRTYSCWGTVNEWAKVEVVITVLQQNEKMYGMMEACLQ